MYVSHSGALLSLSDVRCSAESLLEGLLYLSVYLSVCM